jgi:hypothetical protein
LAEYIIKGFHLGDEEHMLGYFIGQPVKSKVYEPKKIAFVGSKNIHSIYFDGELL